jgi:hypothetical protein
VPSVHAHAQGGVGPHAWGLSLPDRPILLDDVDRLLETSADVELLGRGAPITTWRDALTSILELLTYAVAILAGDVAILRHRIAGGAADGQSVVDYLPPALASPEGVTVDVEGDDDEWDEWDIEFDLAIFDRADQLLSAHHEMAHVDLASPPDVARVLAVVEEQLAGLTSRQRAAEVRLRQIRVAMIRQYREDASSARDRPA